MPAPVPILSLIERFEFHRQAYILGKYNETQLRREFVDKFFSGLGWDVDNNKGFSEAYKEVMHEEPVRIRGTTLFFDYTFRVGGARKFLVETKKPSVHIKDDADSALQLRRYAWNQKLPLSILTNFEEFAVYDCTIKPENSDAAIKGRIEYFTYRDYPAKWDWIVSIFAPDSILRGSFDTYAETTKGKRGTAGVDDDILAEIEQWRDALAKNIALRNPTLSVEELNSVVQRTIDRILFLRICEDRGIEEYATLHKLLEGEQVYSRLCQHFRCADDKYNSGLFHFQQEPDWDELPDTLSLTLAIDDKVLKGIIKRLYYPESPYLFSLIPPAILGHVYEQFLGKVIRLTEGHQAKVEYKPEVKKAGGVFYTPQYIVEYIVKHTVGELVKDKTPRDISKLRILDPACGSGSFLIGAYQYLLDWHRDWYIAHLVPVFKEKNSATDPAVQALLPEQPPKKKKSVATIDLPIYNPGNGKDVRLSERVRSEWKLTTAEKKRILLNNIFGVDIDQQAVEVTKLSLLLKVLEEENQETVSKQLTITAERALPSLDHNIKCGNSLIGWDILTPEMPAEEVKRINPFDWSKEFAPVMAAGGFDAVIGNPPWGSFISQNEKDYLFKKFVNKQGEAESHLFFIEEGIILLKNNGLLGFITPNTWLSVNNSQEIRRYLLQTAAFKEICELSKYIFTKAPDIVPILITLIKERKKDNLCTIKRAQTIKVTETNFTSVFLITIIEQTKWKLDPKFVINLRSTNEVSKILEICATNSISLKEISNVIYGIKTGDNKKYLSKELTKKSQVKTLKTGELTRYRIAWKGYYLDWSRDLAGYRDTPIEVPKIVVQYIRKISLPRRIIAAYDIGGIYYPLNNYSYITQKSEVYSLEYILGIFNSALINFYFANKFVDYNIKPTYLQQLPIRTINSSDPADKARHDRMVSLITQMLDLNKRLQDARLEQEKTQLSRQIEATDGAIDKLVYELYGLTEEEIKVVEGK
ncbi:MAG: hypothetical protein STSR0009_14510 [Methanoregula sp.]